MRLNTATVKQLCSDRRDSGERKVYDPFAFVPSHTLVLIPITRRRSVRMTMGSMRAGGYSIQCKDYRKVWILELCGSACLVKAGPYIMSWIIEGASEGDSRGFQN